MYHQLVILLKCKIQSSSYRGFKKKRVMTFVFNLNPFLLSPYDRAVFSIHKIPQAIIWQGHVIARQTAQVKTYFDQFSSQIWSTNTRVTG